MESKKIGTILYIGITGFILGIFYANFFSVPRSDLGTFLYFLMPILFLSVGMFFVKNRKLLLIGVLFCGFLFGGFRMNIEQNKNDFIESFVGQDMSIKGAVVGETTESKYYRNFELKPVDMDSRKILVRTSYKGELRIGEEIIVSGVLEKPHSFSNESGIEFNYPGFLLAKGVGYILPKAWVEKTGVEQATIKAELFKVKSSFIQNIKSTFNFPESALLSGLLVGSKESLGDEYLERFRVAGLSHIIVLSGFNIAIIATIIMALTSFLPRSFGLTLSAVGVLIFSLMVGFESTVLRATIMVLVALGGKFINRKYDALRALFVAGFLMLLFNPFLLLYDVSFQLSFLASIALVLVFPVLEPFFKWIPSPLGLREIIVSTVSVELLVIPMILYRMGEVSVVSLLSNILVLPIIGPTMLFGFLSGLFGYVSETLAMIVGYPAFLLLRYELFVVDFVSQYKYALLSVGVLSPVILVLIYAAIILWLKVLQNIKV